MTFSDPDLDRFCQLDKLALTVTGQHVDEDRTVLACRVVEPDDPVEGGLLVPPLRHGQRPPRHRDATARARAERVAPHDPAGAGPLLPLRHGRS